MSDDAATIWVVTEDSITASIEPATGGRSSEDVGGGFGSRVVEAVRASVTRRVAITGDALREQMGALLKVMDQAFDHPAADGGLQLDEVELSIEIDSEGHLSVMGSGGKVGGRGGIKLVFKRNGK